MSNYAPALRAYLSLGVTHADLAAKISKTQASVTRYASGDRFPDADTARQIDEATGGAVPFALWQADFMARSGIAA